MAVSNLADEPVAALERRYAELRSELASVGEMRSGSLAERCRRCGKSGCRCGSEADGRGPVLSLTRKRSGKTVTRIIPPGAAAEVRAQQVEYRRFRALSKALVEVGDALSEARLRAAGAARAPAPSAPSAAPASASPAEQAAKKGALRAGRTDIEGAVEALLGSGGADVMSFEALEMGLRRAALAAADRVVAAVRGAEAGARSRKRSRLPSRPTSRS